MTNPTRYFVFNKTADFKRSFCQNLIYSPGEGLQINKETISQGGLFISRLLDSREKETIWHRMVVRSESRGDASIRFTFYTNEERFIYIENQPHDLADFIMDTKLTWQEKITAFRPYQVKSMFNPTDILLHEAKGRYFWFTIELYGQGNLSPVITHMKIYLSKQTWMEYLPEIYQIDQASKSFLERYLSIFQSLYNDLEFEISRISRYYDPEVVDSGFLPWLAEWLAVDDRYIWSEEKLRFLIKNGVSLYKIRGTRKALECMVELYLGEKPYLIEHHQLENYEGEAKTSGLIDRLYGDNSYYFTVVVSEKAVPSVKEHKTLLKIIESAKPAHVEANVVVLKPYIFLDKYSYLGMNSVLGQYRPANLDGFSALPFTGVT